jgi:D-cysteine desulfhydrase
VRGQLRALAAARAELVPAGGVAGAALAVARALARSTLRGERPTLVPTGGSSALGDVGFVSAAFELAEQIEAGHVPEPAEIYLAVGSGGTLSGLALGAKLAGLRARCVGVLVTDILPPSPARLARLAAATLRRLRRLEPALPRVHIGPEDFPLARAQLGAGYGVPTEAARAAAEAALAVGLHLDPVYTSKCLAELLARLRAGSARLPALLWNTYSGVEPPPGEGEPGAGLPPALQRVLDGAAAP